jgi:hypothetical protein
MTPRLKELYYKEIQPALKEKLGFKKIGKALKTLNFFDFLTKYIKIFMNIIKSSRIIVFEKRVTIF